MVPPFGHIIFVVPLLVHIENLSKNISYIGCQNILSEHSVSNQTKYDPGPASYFLHALVLIREVE
jgi:hypothetical protein